MTTSLASVLAIVVGAVVTWYRTGYVEAAFDVIGVSRAVTVRVEAGVVISVERADTQMLLQAKARQACPRISTRTPLSSIRDGGEEPAGTEDDRQNSQLHDSGSI